MPLQATSGTASYDAFGGGAAVEPVYIEQIFQTYLYTGNGSTQTITNGIDLSTKGGMVWIKSRSNATNHLLLDSARTPSYALFPNLTNAQSGSGSPAPTFTTTGFSVNSSQTMGANAYTYASWTFRKQPKFFDVVTYTGDGSASKSITHNLGSVPGCIIVKATSTSGAWAVWHRSGTQNNQYAAFLEQTGAYGDTGANIWGTGGPSVTSTSFTVGTNGTVNASGYTYVAYLFAHNAGGFGLTGTDNVISCGSYTEAATRTEVNLGFEPQWLLVKNASGGGDWYIVDTMRGMDYQSDKYLKANTSDAEFNFSYNFIPTAQGFTYPAAFFGGGSNVIYIAIRRGPMKVPTSGTSVFSPVTYTGNGSSQSLTAGFPIDLSLFKYRGGATNSFEWFDRLRGTSPELRSAYTYAELATTTEVTSFASNTQVTVGASSDTGGTNASGQTYVLEAFRRAPSFFDEVCYTVSGFAANNVAHNLTVTPELFITKPRGSTGGWIVYGSILGATTKYMTLYDTQALQTSGSTVWGATSSTFSEPSTTKNGTYVCYLFATCAGVSKVFSYTGNGSSQTINCGFTAGARWVLIKRTDSTGDWYVWDSARGIVSGNDPHLSLNTTAAEVTTDDTIDTDSTGFVVNQVSATNVNVSSATYIGIAIA